MASRRQIKVDPQSLGEMTVSMLRGEEGFQRKEITKLIEWLKTDRAQTIPSRCVTVTHTSRPAPAMNVPLAEDPCR